MTYSSRDIRTNTIHKQSFVKPKASAVIGAIFLFLLIPRLWADDRKEYIYLDGKAVAVDAGAAGCGPYTLSPEPGRIAKTGGTWNVAVQGDDGNGCTWTVTNVPGWITYSKDNGKVTYTVSANTGPERTAKITIAGQNYVITQDNGCTQSFTPTYNNGMGFAGGTSNVTVGSGTSCTWEASSNASSWVTVTGGASGTGNGTVGYKVEANPGEQRTGTIKIGDNTFTVTQGEHCQLECNLLAAQCSGQPSCEDQCAQEAWSYCGGPSSGLCVDWYLSCVSGCQNSPNSYCNQYQTCQTSCTNACGYALSSTSVSLSSGGTSGTVGVSSAACGWAATSNAPQWLQVTSGASGTGNGTVGYSVLANTGPLRTGTLTIATNKSFTVTQADGCTYDIPSGTNSATISSAGGSGIVTLNRSNAGCLSPAVTSNASWITATVNSSGNVNYTVAANTGPSRTGTLTIATNKTFTVTQADGCTYDIPSGTNSATISSAGGSGIVTLNRSNAGCLSPAVTSNVPWITATVNSSGNVNYTVAGNTGPSVRTGTITIAGNTYTVTQAACTYSISLPSTSVVSGGGSGSASVNCSGGSCQWSASSNVPWITITGGTSGTGNGTVSYKVEPNTGIVRTGTITIGGQPFTINQADGCTYSSISPTNANTAPNGGSGSVTVTRSNVNCMPSAASNVAWITATVNSSGNVNYSVSANYGTGRDGTVTIAGKTFTITQGSGAACATQQQTCSGQTAMCPGQCADEVMSNNPICQVYPSACMDLYNSCMSNCESMVQASCTSQYNQCMAVY